MNSNALEVGREHSVDGQLYLVVSPRAHVMQQVEWAGPPDHCPLCNRGALPTRISQAFAGEAENSRLEVFFQCPFADCRRGFIGIYGPEQTLRNRGFVGLRYELVDLEPYSPPRQEFGGFITKLSPDFVEIYNQALAAETAGLKQICGPGYRKALEFLIKSFLISQSPDQESEIRSVRQLGQCIERFVDNTQVKQNARRATQLGNDETHFERRWLDKDVEDMKVLIRVTCIWIESILVTDHYAQAMP